MSAIRGTEAGNGPTHEEARRLLDGPPGYEEESRIEQFEIDDEIEETSEETTATRSASGLLGSVRRQLNKPAGIRIPVKHLIDPIVHFFTRVARRIESVVSRFANPLLVKRIFVVVFSGLVFALVYFMYVIKIPFPDGHMDHARLRAVLKSSLSANNLRDTTEYFGQMPHFAGSIADRTTAGYVAEFFASLGLSPAIDRHDVYLSHGNTNLLEIRAGQSGETLWSSSLQEGEALANPNFAQKQPPTQMALVNPGEAEGPLVYANFGSQEDFDTLLQHSPLEGTIMLVKYSHEEPGTVALRAKHAGVAGLLFMSSKHPTDASWPEGPDYAWDSVQQGSIGCASIYPGDILSPGWPSTKQQMLDRSRAYTADIPIAAISWNDAERLLNSLQGSGTQVEGTWTNYGAPDIKEWWTGPSSDLKVYLNANPTAENRHQITNVFGKMQGREQDRVIVLGARLDAMCYGATQLSGLVVLLEVAQALAKLQYSQHWHSLRSIYFVAWDGTAHNWAGSTEWVESVSDHLSVEGVAYIDLDGVSGTDFVVQGNPLIDVKELLAEVKVGDATLWDYVDQAKSMRPIVGNGNHLAFEVHTGVPSIKLGFQSKGAVPVDSCYDSIEWMRRYGDPDYSRHLAFAEFVSYLTLELGNSPLVPFNFETLASQISKYVDYIEGEAFKTFTDESQITRIRETVANVRGSVEVVTLASMVYTEVRRQWDEFALTNRDPDSGIVPESIQIARYREYWNERATQANTALLDRNGILHRNWFKNHLFGPASDFRDDDILPGVFPGVQDALNLHAFNEFVDTLTDAAVHFQSIALYLQNTST